MACSKRSLLMSLCLGIAAAFTATWRTVSDAAHQVHALYCRAADWVIERVATAAGKAQPLEAPRAAVLLVQAKAFVLRLAKRETPRVMPGWRMCPST